MPRFQSGQALVQAETAIGEGNREFAFTDADFRALAKLAYDHAGIALSDNKRNLVYSRLSRRLRALGLRSFREYWTYLTETSGEVESFINSISTNHTKFFREAHHFDHLRSHVVTPFVRGGGGRLRIWSAGCSTGEEPYTIASVLRRDIRDMERHDVRILATDIDTEVLGKAVKGQYPTGSLGDIPAEYREVMQAGSGRVGGLAMSPNLQALITFRQLNLLGPWPFKGPFDAIFCRNVIIYFDAPTKTALVDRFIQYLKPGGWLYLGHSESLLGSHHNLKLVGRTTYRREA